MPVSSFQLPAVPVAGARFSESDDQSAIGSCEVYAAMYSYA